MEKINWSPYQDSILQLLREQRKIQRWTDIAKTLATEFQIKGRNGKHCRQRYDLLLSKISRKIRFYLRQLKLVILRGKNPFHTSQLTWQQMGHYLQKNGRKVNILKRRSDNCIKNHFYSRLRKGLKKLNKGAEQGLEKRFKEIKFNVLFKIIEASEDGFKNNFFCEADTSKQCLEIKNKLIALSYQDDEDHDYNPQEIDCVELYEEIEVFNRNYKRKPKKFRRIPTKSYDLKQRQNSLESDEMKSTISEHEQDEEQEAPKVNLRNKRKEPKKENEIQNEGQQLFRQFEQEFYKINEMKSAKKRRVSAQTTGVEQALYCSGILEEQRNLPALGLAKKGTSYLSLFSEQLNKENIFFDQYDLNSDCFLMKDLMSMKRLSHTDSRLFD